MTDLKKKLREANKLRLEIKELENNLQVEVKAFSKEKMAHIMMKSGMLDDLMKDVFKNELSITGDTVDMLEAFVKIEEKANPKELFL